MFNNFKLGAKIGIGFGLLIVISLTLGGIAVFNMRDVTVESTKLATEHVPQVDVAALIRGASNRIMYAMRAAEAAKDTAHLIEGTVKKVTEGSDLVNDTNRAFTEVADSTARVAGLIGEISRASNEQAQGITQINQAVSEMDKITQNNVSSAEESASASEEMSAQAEQMKLMVYELIALVRGAENRNFESMPARPVKKNHPVEPEAALISQAGQVPGRVKREIDQNRIIPMDEGEFENF